MIKMTKEQAKVCSKHETPLKWRKDEKGKITLYCVECQQEVIAFKKGRGKK